MKKTPLQVTLRATEPSTIDLTVGDHVQLDRVVPSPHGHVAERAGRLIPPGTTQLELAQGTYFFKTLSDARLHVVRGGVETRIAAPADKNPFPEPPPRTDGSPVPNAKGDAPRGEAPVLVVE